jgi:hypothetical protein
MERKHYWIEVLAGPIAMFVGILVGALGVIYTVNANHDNERDRQAATAAAERVRQEASIAAQRQDQKSSFELTAAQVVMSQRNCTLARARAKQLVRLFPLSLKVAHSRG